MTEENLRRRLWADAFGEIHDLSPNEKVHLERLVQSLQPEDQWLIGKRYYEGKLMREIAPLFPKKDGGTGASVSVVSSKIRGALRRLRRMHTASAPKVTRTGFEWTELILTRLSAVTEQLRTKAHQNMTAEEVTAVFAEAIRE